MPCPGTEHRAQRGWQRLLARTPHYSSPAAREPKGGVDHREAGRGQRVPARPRGAATRPGTHLSASVGSQRPLPRPLRAAHESCGPAGVCGARASKAKDESSPSMMWARGWQHGGRGRSLLPPAGRAGACPRPRPAGLLPGSWE